MAMSLEPALRFALRAPEDVNESELEPALRLAFEPELEVLLELDEDPDCDEEDELAPCGGGEETSDSILRSTLRRARVYVAPPTCSSSARAKDR